MPTNQNPAKIAALKALPLDKVLEDSWNSGTGCSSLYWSSRVRTRCCCGGRRRESRIMPQLHLLPQVTHGPRRSLSARMRRGANRSPHLSISRTTFFEVVVTPFGITPIPRPARYPPFPFEIMVHPFTARGERISKEISEFPIITVLIIHPL